MATKSRRTEDRQSRSLKNRLIPFVSLLCAVPITFGGWVLLHLAVREDVVARVLWVLIVLVAGAGLAALAWGIAAGRRALVRGHVTASVGLAFAGGAVTVAVGWPARWALTYGVLGVFLAVSWMLYRLDALRADKGEGDGEDDLKSELGLKNVRFNRAKQFFDDKGELVRVETPIKLTRGATMETVQGALGSLESVANSVAKRGRVIGGETAQEAHLTLIMKDMMKEMIPWPGPSAPGGCITEPIRDGMFEDQQPGVLFLAGNHPDAPNPSSRGQMGMTRTGKTLTAQCDVLEIVTRQRVVIFWFDSVKGAQTVVPLRPAFDILVADDVESGNPKLFRQGMKAMERLIRHRAGVLGRAGYRQWTPKAADELGIPLVYCHLEEADILCAIAGDELTFLASKGLSVGLVLGISLQRADAVSMPTGLRFNVGTWDCFGCGDAVSVGFALSDSTIAAGAHPEEWRQSKPGYHYREGIGIPQQRWPVLRKGFFVEDAEMAAHVAKWAPRMWSLDTGSQNALGDWYLKMKQIMANDPTGEVGTTMPLPGANGNGRRAVPTTTFTIDGEEDEEAREARQFREEAAEEIVDMRESGEIPRDEEDPEMGRLDPTKPLAADPPGTPEVTWTNPPAAPSPEAAAEAFDRALFQLAADPTLWDQSTGEVVFQVATLVERYKFRTRPWFSIRLSDVVEGRTQVKDPTTGQPANLTLERGDKTGQYRMRLQRQLEAA
jgi:hypothetical protein